MNHILDIIFAAILLLTVFVAAKRGIVLTVFDIAGGVISFLFAKLISPQASQFIYDNYVREKVIDFLSQKYADAENAVSGAADSLLSVFDFLPKGISEYAKSSGLLNGETLSSELMGKITTVGELESQIVSPVVTTLLNILCFAVIAIVCLILLKILSRFLAKLVTASKIAKKLDSSLGAVFGLLKGLIYVFIIAAVVNVVSCASPSFAEYAANSYICSFASKIIGL